MNQAKQAVEGFMHRKGKHDTTVDEVVAPAVTQETVNKTRHEEQQTAIDREVHQDHYHTSVQAVKDKEVLPEHHEHRMAPVQTEEHHHGKDREIQHSLDQERQHFRDQRVEGATRETTSTAPTIAGEHVHHHVHETIQPVVQKETIQPSVVHTTVPVQEIHHNDPKHHAASALPAISMADFKAQGGTLTGREERHDGFAGEPKGISSSLGSAPHEHGHSTGGEHKSGLMNKVDPRVDSDRDGSRNAGMAEPGTHAIGSTRHGDTPTGDHLGSSKRDYSPTSGNRSGMGTTGTTGVGTGLGTTGHRDTHDGYGNESSVPPKKEKASFMDKLNPKKDADGDGKPGFMK